MSGKRGSGGENPWVKPPPEDDEDDFAADPLPPSPWLQEVPPPPSPWATAGSEGSADDTTGAGGGTGQAESGPGFNGPTAGGWGTTDQSASGTTTSGWGATDPGASGQTAGGWGATDPDTSGPTASGWGTADPAATIGPAPSGWGTTDSGASTSGSTAPGATDPGSTGPGTTGPGLSGSGSASTGGGGPAQDSSAPWGNTVGPPSLRRTKPEPAKRKLPPLLIPIAAGLLVVALIAVALVLLTGGDESADPAPPSPSPTPSTPSTYSPPANAIPVAFGVSVVPVDGWSVLAKETQGKNLVTYAPNKEARAFFWVRQRQGVSAKEYLLRIVEGETQGETTQLGKERNLPCPKDVLVECAAITYTSAAKGVKVRGFVETYRRKDGVVTAIDFRTRVDYAQKAEGDATVMKKSVIDSL